MERVRIEKGVFPVFFFFFFYHLGLPYPQETRRGWAGETASRITSLFPSNDAIVVEIGVGSGIILTRVLSACGKFIGIFFTYIEIRFKLVNI